MAENTHISWATDTFNPWWGCRQVSPACRFCYAKAWDKRWGGTSWGAHGERRIMSDSYWRKPLKWNREAAADGRTRRVFCASMADVFEDHPALVEPRSRLWDLIEQTPNLNWLLLTKRPENAAGMVPGHWASGWPRQVWCGVSAETQKFADQRIPVLLSLPVTGERFVSAAPLLGPVDLTEVAPGLVYRNRGFNALVGVPRISWVITEGESGVKARPSHPDWFRSLRDQCRAAAVAFHHKQNGEWQDGSHNPGTQRGVDHVILRDGRHVAWADFAGSDLAKGDPRQRDGACVISRVGIKAAGRLLDGELWDQVPGEMAVTV